jgi:hypothetical protein
MSAPENPALGGAAVNPNPYFGLTGAQADTARRKDEAVKALRPFRTQPTSPEYARLLEALRDSPATGCATVLDYIRREAKYVPTDPNTFTLAMFYDLLSKHPLFTEKPFDSFQFDLETGTGKSGGDAESIARRFQASDGIATTRIREQVQWTMEQAISNPGRTQERNLLQEYSLGVTSEITFLYINTILRVHIDRIGPMMFIGKMHGERYGMHFAFNTAKWPQYVDQVVKDEIKTIDDWLAGR